MALKAQSIQLIIKNTNPPAAGRLDRGIGDGFGIRIYASGKKHFVTRYRPAGQKNPRTFVHHPHFPQLSVSEALKAHALIKAEIINGKDPLAERLSARQEAADRKTVQMIFEIYIEQAEKEKKDSYIKDTISRYEKHIKPAIGKTAVKTITEKDCKDLILKIKEKVHKSGAGSGDNAAKKCLGILNRIFEFAIQTGEIESLEHPSRGLNSKILSLKDSEIGERYLTLEEVSKFWSGLDYLENNTAKMKSGMSAMKFMILTGLRTQEVRHLEKSWITENNDGSGVANLPAEVMKGGREHSVYLSKFTMKIISNLLKEKNTIYVFPSKYLKNGALAAMGEGILNSIIYDLFSEKHKQLEIEHFTPHDLRRTFATGLKEHFNTADEIIHKMIAHSTSEADPVSNKSKSRVSKILTKTYIKHVNHAGHAEIWQSWSDLIEAEIKKII